MQFPAWLCLSICIYLLIVMCFEIIWWWWWWYAHEAGIPELVIENYSSSPSMSACAMLSCTISIFSGTRNAALFGASCMNLHQFLIQKKTCASFWYKFLVPTRMGIYSVGRIKAVVWSLFHWERKDISKYQMKSSIWYYEAHFFAKYIWLWSLRPYKLSKSER